MNLNNEYSNLREKYTDLLEQFAEQFFDSLLSKKILASKKNENGKIIYEISDKPIIEQEIIVKKDDNIFDQFSLLQQIIVRVLEYLNFPKHKEIASKDLYDVLISADELNIINLNWKDNKPVTDVIKGIRTYTSSDLKLEGQLILLKNKVNPRLNIYQSIEFFGREYTKRTFIKYDFLQKTGDFNNLEQEYDLVLSRSLNQPKLFFEFKFRSKAVLPTAKELTQIVDLIKMNNLELLPIVFYVVFTNKNTNFGKEKIDFKKLISQMSGHDSVLKNFYFLPISINNLGLLRYEYEDFIKENILNSISHTFSGNGNHELGIAGNDDYLDERIDFKTNNIEIIIKPKKSKFWRLGFRFSEDGKYPVLSDERHAKELGTDVHISVGDFTETTKIWSKPDKIEVLDYVWDIKRVIYRSIQAQTNYNSEEVRLVLKSNEDGSQTSITLFIGSKEIGLNRYDFSGFKSCKIGAWCDYKEFELDTTIQIRPKGRFYPSEPPA